MQRAGGTVNRFTADRVYRLTGISAPGLTAAYTYNGNGLRVARTVSGVTERDTWATVFGMAQVLVPHHTSSARVDGGA